MTHRHTPSMDHKRLYGDSRHPYYVVAPDYQRSSAGIRVMHQFCAALRMCGQEAWMSTGVTGPLLGTPKLTAEIREQHLAQGRVPIAVYPEVIGRNPLHCHVVTRYILNKPGLLGEKPHFKDSDLLFVYEPELLAEAPSPWGVLHLPSIDTSVFHNRDNPDDHRRQGWCVYAGRHAQGLTEHPALFTDCTVITRDWPSTREDMAALFRRSEGVYCFENTAISMEARLCGCPVVQLPSKLYDPSQFFGSGLGLAKGISFSTDPQAVETACAELTGLSAGYEALEDQFWQGLDQWIHDTQALAANVAHAPPGPVFDDMPPDDPAYRAWYQLNAPGGPQAQHLATRMVLDWVGTPSVHLLMAVRPGELDGFVQTLPSLQAQVFDNWMLTIATTEPAPASVQAQPRIQWLQARDAAHLDTILHEMAKASGGEWLGFLSVGTQLDPLGLQAWVDATQRHPSWQLVFGDDDVQSEDGRAYNPRLKPVPDLITLCGVSFLDGLVLIRKTAYTAAIGAMATGHAPIYTLALQLLAAGHADAIGHVDGIWAHLPESTTTSSAEIERLTALAQLQQASISADVLPRNTAHLRVVQPTPPLAPLPVTALMLGADTLEACLAQWRHLLGMAGAHGLQTCLIANRLTSPTDTQLLRAAVTIGPELTTTVVDLQGLNEGEALVELAPQISTPLTWILGPNTIPMQTDGLHHLAAWMNWPGVAAVQPGLWDMTTGQMRSPGFAPGLVWEPMTLAPETIDNAPTQQRTLASLNGEGVLIQTTALQKALQRMSSPDRALWPLALSRQLTQAGQTMVWKPEVVCNAQAVTPHLGKKALARQFLTQNLTWLTSNGAYNPRLSLRKPALVDAQRSTPWLGLLPLTQRCLLLQEECSLFPQDHLSNLAQIGEAADASLALWTVSASDSPDVLLLEIVRAGPHAVYFSSHTARGPLAVALQQLVEHVPTIQRICCIAPLPTDTESTDAWALLDWLAHHQRALRLAHRGLATAPAPAETLKTYHPDVKLVDLAGSNGPDNTDNTSDSLRAYVDLLDLGSTPTQYK